MLSDLKSRYGQKYALVMAYLIAMGLAVLSGSSLFLISAILRDYTLIKISSSFLGVYILAVFIEGKFIKFNTSQTLYYKKLLKPIFFLSLCFLVFAIIIFLIT
ncbi:hypothetical protein ACFO25_18965 [Paenactinomyces guangxiensis]|uniref:Uncharacterized protein n=1 Tax=Paenactinomyces guangxiensis TaxID=1490290 RepID=A0A7W2A9L4_9BACL|nr:hypothetical protein [Paenactinomyces guangxiensis]MBA4495394.1 hypothetical protein [Paenactinomyces guangxiensis]MBH8592485.1 hypothetical protein [Paenactinomyces guangxiensis]